jgi:hypothetical protein
MRPVGRFYPGTSADRNRLRNGLVVAVDLGFSEKARSCGVAWRRGDASPETRALRFGECVGHLERLVANSDRSEMALIIEAPLSSRFDAERNPIPRHFEETPGQRVWSERGRGWYHGGGAVVALGALFFLFRLRESLALRDTTIVIFEGFVTRKAKKSAHVDDARALLDAFRDTKTPEHGVAEPEGGRRFTVLEMIGDGGEVAPLVLVPRP